MRSSIKRLPIADIRYAPYQRPLEGARVAKMAKACNRTGLGYPLVSFRDDEYWCVDGQHRIEMMRSLGATEITVELMTGCTYEGEARLWSLRNNFRSPQPLARFNALVQAEDPEAVAIVALVKDSGWSISGNYSGGGVRAVAALQAMHRFSPASLELALTVLHRAWPADADAVISEMIRGFTRFTSRFGDEIDVPNLVHRLQKFPGGPAAFIGRAKGNTEESKSDRQVEALLVGQYNKGRNTGRIDPLKNRLK